MAKATTAPAPARRAMPAKGGTSTRKASPGEFGPVPAAPTPTPAEDK